MHEGLEAWQGHPPEPGEMVFLVLTLDQEGTKTGKRWPDVATAYRSLVTLHEKFKKRVIRALKKVHAPEVEGENRVWWIETVEQHASGWPHMNVLIRSETLAGWVRASQELRSRAGITGRGLLKATGRFEKWLRETGWGPESTVEVAASRNALERYMVKCASEFEKVQGEMAKHTQLPLSAPLRTRRFRACRGAVAKRRRKTIKVHALGPNGVPLFGDDGKPIYTEVPATTGVMVVRKPCPTGFVDVVPTNRVAPERQERARQCCAFEEEVWLDEQRQRIRAKEPPRAVQEKSADWVAQFELARRPDRLRVTLPDSGPRGPPGGDEGACPT